MPSKINIGVLTMGAGTQQRPVDKNLVEEYAALIKAKIDLPPIEVIKDGAKLYVWDGFHRIKAMMALGLKTILANVQDGTLKDAIWLSFGANKKHGKRRQPGVTRAIITKILTDSRWAKTTLPGIADHVGVTPRYVKQIKADLLEDEKVANDSKNSQKGVNCSPPLSVVKRAETVTVKSSTGKQYEQKSQEKGTTKTASDQPTDKLGNVIPKHLLGTWNNRAVIQVYINDFKALIANIKEHINDADGVMAGLESNVFFKVYVSNFRRGLENAQPYVICTSCGGRAKSCKHCERTGFISKQRYALVPPEKKYKVKK